MAALICIDFLFTVGTLVRYTGRHAGKSAITFIGRAVDKVFDDAFMGVRFPAMKF